MHRFPGAAAVRAIIAAAGLAGTLAACALGGGTAPGVDVEFLRSGTWIVERLDGSPVAPDELASLRFDAGGRAAGRAFCNSWTGPYRIESEKLSFGNAASTRRACAPALMALESRFFEALRAIERVERGADGTLRLLDAGGVRIIARQMPRGSDP